jgi:hypothetical protein
LIDALINKTEDNEFRFFHSSFSNLLLLSIISKETNFDLKYPNGIGEFFQISFKKYFTSLTNESTNKYPYKIAFSLTKLLVNRQIDLYKFLVKDQETQGQIINYFKDVADLNEHSLFLSQISSKCGNLFNYYYSVLINETKTKEIFAKKFETINELKTVAVIFKRKSPDYLKKIIHKLPQNECKKIILNSNLNDISNALHYFIDYDPVIPSLFTKCLNSHDWLALLNHNTVASVVKSLFIIKKIKGLNFINEISKQLDKEKIIANSKYESIEQIAKSIKELTSINRDLAKEFASLISENEISIKIQNQPIKKISKSLKELAEFKQTEIFNVVTNITDDYLIMEMEKTNLSIAGKALSDFFDITPHKIKSLIAKKEFQNLLLDKFGKETDAGQVGKIIAYLKKIEPKAVVLFLSRPTTSTKIKSLVENANLQQLGELIYNIFRMKEFSELSKKIFLSIPSNIIVNKALDAKNKITNYDTPFHQLSNVDWDKTIEILELIENDSIIKQAVGFKLNSTPIDYARKVSFTFKSLNELVPAKITEIILQVLKSYYFSNKIDELSKTDLLHCYANFAEINTEYANEKFRERVENLTYEDIKNENISAFPDGLRLLKSPLNLTQESFLITSFEKHLIRNYKNFALSQISYAFKNLFSIDEKYAFKLIAKLDLEFLSKNIYSIKNKAKETSILGEIKTVNTSFYDNLIIEIERLKTIET